MRKTIKLIQKRQIIVIIVVLFLVLVLQLSLIYLNTIVDEESLQYQLYQEQIAKIRKENLLMSEKLLNYESFLYIEAQARKQGLDQQAFYALP